MANRDTTNNRLDGWDAIADYLGWHPRTVIRWEKQKGLPVHRVLGGKRHPVYAFRHELDQWFQSADGVSKITSTSASMVEAGSDTVRSHSLNPARRLFRLPISIFVAAAILLVSAFSFAWRFSTPPVIQITGMTQLTDDGIRKQNLVTDGNVLYFSENVGDEKFLSAMAVTGGPIRRIPFPVPNPYPEDISRDGKALLVVPFDTATAERPLWIVPTNGDPPSRVGTVNCGSAAWSPRGDWIAFGQGKAIYLTASDGSQTRLLSTLEVIPQRLQWSDNDKHLMVSALALPADNSSLWQIDLDDDMHAESITPVEASGKLHWGAALLSRNKVGYLAVVGDSAINYIVQLKPRLFSNAGSFELASLTTRFEDISGVASDSTSQRVFVLSGQRGRGELMQYNSSTRSFTILLPGTSATYVDVSRQGDRLVYVRSPDATMWISKRDGSDAHQVSLSDMAVQLPRWSPDGKRIAFMGRVPQHPYRIYVLTVDNQVVKEASVGDDNQGAPTWSPDGKFVVYGDVRCQEMGTCAVHRIDLASGKVVTLAGSQGLATARWSPDGKYIAALNPTKHELCLFDLAIEQWRLLSDGINGNDVSWSSDSQFVYTKSTMTGHAEILRVATHGGPLQVVFNLDSFSKSAGELDTWFGLMPDNTLLLNHWLNPTEIYELSYRTR